MKLLITLAALAGMLGTGLGETVRVYFGTQGRGTSKGIYFCELDRESGALSEPKLAAEIGSPGFLVLSPDQKHLYSTARGEGGAGGVAAFRIRNDGLLEKINQQPCEGKGPCFVGLDGTGQALMVANYGSGSVAALKVREDGSLAKSQSSFNHEGSSVNQKRQKGPHAHSIYAGPKNKFAYAPDLGIDEVVIYKLAADAATLTPFGAAKMPPGSGPRHMKFGKDGKQAYVLSELLLTVVVFDRNPDGSLAQKQVVDVLPEGESIEGMTCSEILVSPGGKTVYTANRDVAGMGRDSLSVLTVGEEGKLKLLQNLPAKVEIPRNINLSPDGKWLLVAGQKSGNVPVFAVSNKGGKLIPTPHEIKVANAMCVVFAR